MKKILLILICIVFSFFKVFSQSDSTIHELTEKEINKIVKGIKEYYYKCNIEYSVDHITINGTNASWPGLGKYGGKITFHKDYFENTYKIELNIIESEYKYYNEWLYYYNAENDCNYTEDKEGNLIFYFYNSPPEGYTVRAYYYDNQLIKIVTFGEYINGEEKEEEIYYPPFEKVSHYIIDAVTNPSKPSYDLTKFQH